MLACLWAVECWEKFLLGRHFTLRTDHGALLTLLKQHTTTRKSAKFTRWLERLSRFDYDVEHIRGSNNCMADALSHLPLLSSNAAIEDDESPELMATIAALSSSPISIEAIRNHSKQDKLLAQVIHFTKSGWPTKKHVKKTLLLYYNVRDKLSVEEGCLTRAEHQFVIPTAMQQTILNAAHEGHPGIVRTKWQLQLTYWWPGMDSRVENHVKHCIACQDSAKSHKPAKVPLTHIEPPTQPWTKIALDISGPFATAPRSQHFIAVAIDYTSGYPEVLLSDDITSGHIICWLTEVFVRFGNLSIIVMDNGRQFISSEFEAFLQQHDILHWTAAVYNPQQNGKVKAFNHFLKHGAQTFHASSRQFADGIQDLLFNYRATSPTPDGRSPAELLFGRRMRTNYEPAHRAAPRVQNAASEHGQNYQVEQQLPKLCGPYQLHDLVRVRLPHVVAFRSNGCLRVRIRLISPAAAIGTLAVRLFRLDV